jgi:two-component system, sporulation sensor kinase E
MNKKTILLLRFVLILATILIMAYSKRGLDIASPTYIVALLYLLTNLVLYFVPETKFSRPLTTFGVFLTDIVAISLAIYFTQGMQTDFYLIYFLIIFIASVGQDIRGSIFIAIVASALYGWLLVRSNPGISILDSAILIRVPFLFIVSLISSYWSATMRRQLKSKQELEEFAHNLEDEVARITAKETELRRYSETVINSVASGVIAVRGDGTITTVNPEAARVLGKSQSSLVDRKIETIQGLDTLWQKMKKAIDTNKPFERLQVSITNAQEKIIPIGLSVSPMSSPDTKFTGCVAILRDLSEVKALELKLKHAERLSYLGKMASWVAHEIRNPLTVIDGFSQLLAHTSDKEKIKTFSTEIHKGTKRINHIIEDILTFARTKTQVKFGTVNLWKMMKEITENISDVRIFIKGDENMTVIGEEESLKSLFLNIIHNSIDAMDKDPQMIIEFRESNKWVITELVDNGKGISQDDLKNLFTPFFTTKSRGTGLGLAIVKKIVDDHNGKLEIESEEGKGTTCRVSLPKGGKS